MSSHKIRCLSTSTQQLNIQNLLANKVPNHIFWSYFDTVRWPTMTGTYWTDICNLVVWNGGWKNTGWPYRPFPNLFFLFDEEAWEEVAQSCLHTRSHFNQVLQKSINSSCFTFSFSLANHITFLFFLPLCVFNPVLMRHKTDWLPRTRAVVNEKILNSF